MRVDIDKLEALELDHYPRYMHRPGAHCAECDEVFPCRVAELVREARELRGIAEAARGFYADILRSKEVPTIFRVCAEEHAKRLARYDAGGTQ